MKTASAEMKRYRVKNFSLTDEKMERHPQVNICGTATWKAKVVAESQRRKISISELVRQAIAEKCGW